MQVFARLKGWLSSILESIEAGEVGGGLRWNEREVERQAVLHERHGYPLDDRTSLLELLNHKLLNLPVPIVELLDVELVENADSDPFEKTWRVNLGVRDTLDVSDLG